MTIDEAKFQILEQNLQALTQAVYKLVYSLSDLKLLLSQNKLLVHPEEKSDIPEHSLFAQVKRIEREEAATHNTACNCPGCASLKRRQSCTGDYYGPL